MYVDDTFQPDIMDAFERHAREGAVIVSSSMPVPATNSPGDNPPHAKAKARYLEILDEGDQFVCTQEWPNEESPRSVAFGLTAEGLVLLDPVDLVDLAEDAGAGERVEKAASVAGVVVGLLIALAAAGVVRGVQEWKRRRTTAAQTPEPGLDRAQRAIAKARGQSAAPRQPIGFGTR
jgi:hypothetical protein